MDSSISKYPNILFVSSNAFSTRNANGRVMEQLVHDVPDANLSMIYFSGPDPDIKKDASYLKITDKEKMKGFFKKRNLGCFLDANHLETITKSHNRNKHSGTHSALSLLVREFIWKHGKWDRANIAKLVIDNKPDVVVLNASRNIFIIDLAIYLKKEYDLPIVVYTTEDECFHHPSFFNLFSFIFYSKVRKAYKRLYEFADETIVFHEGLKRLYDEKFKINSHVIMMSTDIDKASSIQDLNLFTYAGNIDRGRDRTLIEIANCLSQISNDYKLRVISPNLKLANKSFKNIQNIIISEPLPYEDFKKAIHSSPVAFNIESFLKKDKKLIGATFSCKTADLLGGNSPLLVVGPKYTYVVEYFLAHPECALVATDYSEIKPALLSLLQNREKVSLLVQNAHNLIGNCFDISKNSQAFIQVVLSVISKEEKDV